MYSIKELSEALEGARAIINSRTKEVDVYTRGYNDCWSLIVEYDRLLRGEHSLFAKLDLTYKNSIDYLRQLKLNGYDTVHDLALKGNYEIIRTLKPQFGDVAFELSKDKTGGAMIAGDGFWVSTSEHNTGVCDKRPQFFFERKLTLLARPLRS